MTSLLIILTDDQGYQWQEGATKIATSLSTNIEPKIHVLHSLHVLEIIEAARRSSKEGIKGLLVDAYGMYSESLNEEMIQKLTIKH